ncbi:hypothetical protein Tco_0638502 [Tanacetum coccineum]
MCTDLKNMEGKKPKDLKNKSFDSIQKMFDRAFKRVNTFVDFRTDLVEDEEEVALDAIPLAVKSPSIVDWKIHKEGKKSYYQIIRADGSSKMYLVFSHMLKSFDREDLETLYKLVKAKYGSTRPVEDLDLVLYGDLKTMFEPHVEDNVWKNQSDYRVLDWKLYDSCGVHSLRKQNVHIHMLVEKRYPLTTPTISTYHCNTVLGTIGIPWYVIGIYCIKTDSPLAYNICSPNIAFKDCLDLSSSGEALVLVYNRFAQLMNDLERNDMHFPIQFEKLVNVSRAKKLEKSHDPLALVAHTGSSSRNTSSYYVTHPTSVVDYEDEYQQDDVHTNSEDPLTSAMLLLARAITQNFSTPTNNRLRTSSNTRNQAIIQGDMVNIQSMNSGNTRRNNRRAYVQDEIVEGSNAPNETGNDEAGVLLTDEQNDFLFADASKIEDFKELSANILLMVRIQSADNTSDVGPSYDSAFISEVQSSSNTDNEEQMYPIHTKIINSTIGDDQIDSNIIFDSPNGNVNSGSIEKDTHVLDLCALEQLARNAY